MAAKTVSGKEILTLLQEGYVRYKKDKTEDSVGSIEEKLGVTALELRDFLKHPKLANFRYKPVVKFVDDFEEDKPTMVDDFEEPSTNTEAVLEGAISNVEAEEESVFN